MYKLIIKTWCYVDFKIPDEPCKILFTFDSQSLLWVAFHTDFLGLYWLKYISITVKPVNLPSKSSVFNFFYHLNFRSANMRVYQKTSTGHHTPNVFSISLLALKNNENKLPRFEIVMHRVSWGEYYLWWMPYFKNSDS